MGDMPARLLPKVQADLLKRVLRFCEAADIRPETFGRRAANDARLIAGMKKGRELRYRTRQKIESYMAKEIAALQRKFSKVSANIHVNAGE
jgi:hypothetical protein